MKIRDEVTGAGMINIRTNESFVPQEIAIWNGGVDVLVNGWLPCKHPERPIDKNAAVKHFFNGEPCRPCAIAQEADIMRRGKASGQRPKD